MDTWTNRLRPDTKRQRERGAISIMAAFALIVSLISAALAVDIGRLAFETRHLQLVADMASLDAALCVGSGLSGELASVQNAAQASAVRNGFEGNLLTPPNSVRVGTVATDANGIRQFTPAGGAATANAVQVVATGTFPTSLIAGGLFSGTAGQTGLGELGVAIGGPIVSLSAGSFLGRFDTGNSALLNPLLGGLLGTTLALDTVSYQGLMTASLTLGDLVVAAGAGSTNDLLTLDVDFPTFLNMIVQALYLGGEDAAAATVNGIVIPLVPGFTVPLGGVLVLTTESEQAAAEANLNVFDLIVAGAQVANGESVVTIPSLPVVNIPGVTSVNLQLQVIEPPQIAVGPPGRDQNGDPLTEVHTAQIRFRLSLSLVSTILGPGAILNVIGEVAQTTAFVESFDCVTGVVTVNATPGIASMAVGRLTPSFSDPNPTIQPLNILGLVEAAALVQLSSGGCSQGTIPGPFPPNLSSGAVEMIEFSGPFPQTDTVGTPLGQAVDTVLGCLADSLNVRLLGISLPLLDIATLLETLRPTLRALDSILMPFFQALGVTVGGADVSINSLTTTRELVI